MSHRVDCAEQEYNHWRCVQASNLKLRKSIPKGGRRAEENDICNLTKQVEIVYYRMLRSTYVDANSESEQKSLWVA